MLSTYLNVILLIGIKIYLMIMEKFYDTYLEGPLYFLARRSSTSFKTFFSLFIFTALENLVLLTLV